MKRKLMRMKFHLATNKTNSFQRLQCSLMLLMKFEILPVTRPTSIIFSITSRTFNQGSICIYSTKSFLRCFVRELNRGSGGSSHSSESSFISTSCSSPSSETVNRIQYFLQFTAISFVIQIQLVIAYFKILCILCRHKPVRISSVIIKFFPSLDSKISFATSFDGILMAFTKTIISNSHLKSLVHSFWGFARFSNRFPLTSKNSWTLGSLISLTSKVL